MGNRTHSMITLIAGKQQKPPSRAEKASCITHCWKQQDRLARWPILCETISPEKGMSKKSFGQPTLSCSYSHCLTSCNGPLSSSLPLSTGEEVRSVWLSPRQTQLIHLKDVPKEGFPRMWPNPCHPYVTTWTSLSTLTDVGAPVGLCYSHNKIYGWEVSWILQLVHFW